MPSVHSNTIKAPPSVLQFAGYTTSSGYYINATFCRRHYQFRAPPSGHPISTQFSGHTIHSGHHHQYYYFQSTPSRHNQFRAPPSVHIISATIFRAQNQFRAPPLRHTISTTIFRACHQFRIAPPKNTICSGHQHSLNVIVQGTPSHSQNPC